MWPHAIVDQFHQHWNLTDSDRLLDMIDECLSSDTSNRWWKREAYRPKEILLQLIQADPELAFIAFKDLSNQSAPLEGRLSRFEYYCNELLQMHRQKDVRSIDAYHHQDASMISLYLAGIFPDQHALYPGLKIFSTFCRTVGTLEIPVVDDLTRYSKVCTIVNTFLQKNEHLNRVEDNRKVQLRSTSFHPFQMVYEVISFGGGNPQLTV